MIYYSNIGYIKLADFLDGKGIKHRYYPDEKVVEFFLYDYTGNAIGRTFVKIHVEFYHARLILNESSLLMGRTALSHLELEQVAEEINSEDLGAYVDVDPNSIVSVNSLYYHSGHFADYGFDTMLCQIIEFAYSYIDSLFPRLDFE